MGDQGSNFGEESQSQSDHSPTSSSGLTIEEFLTRYPEVKRLSSRFGDDPPNTESPFKLNHKKQNKHNKKKNKNNRNHQQQQQQQQQQLLQQQQQKLQQQQQQKLQQQQQQQKLQQQQ